MEKGPGNGWKIHEMPVNPVDGRVMDPVWSGQYPQMGSFQPSVTHRDFSIAPYTCHSESTPFVKNSVDRLFPKRSGYWLDRGYLPPALYGLYSNYNHQRFTTTHRLAFPEFPKDTHRRGMPLHYPPDLHCYWAKR